MSYPLSSSTWVLLAQAYHHLRPQMAPSQKKKKELKHKKRKKRDDWIHIHWNLILTKGPQGTSTNKPAQTLDYTKSCYSPSPTIPDLKCWIRISTTQAQDKFEFEGNIEGFDTSFANRRNKRTEESQETTHLTMDLANFRPKPRYKVINYTGGLLNSG